MKSTRNILPAVLLSLVAIVISACGSSDSASQSAADSAAATPPAGTGSSLSLSASSTSVLPNGEIQLYPSGGNGSYTFVNYSGFGTLNTSTGLYVAPDYDSTEILEVTDSAGDMPATVTITISSSASMSGGTLALSAGSSYVAPSGAVSFSVSGGTPPYQYQVLAGSGSLSIVGQTYSTVVSYTASASDSGVVQVVVTDSSSPEQVAYSEVSVSASGSGTSVNTPSFTANADVLLNDVLGITYYNSTNLSYPEFIFYGTGNRATETTEFAHSTVDVCGWDGYGDTLAPCTIAVPITNYTNSITATTTYEGTIVFDGPNGGGSVSFCIPPVSYPLSAYILAGQMSGSAAGSGGGITGSGTGSSGFGFLQMSYSDMADGRGFMQGAPTMSFDAETNTSGEHLYTSVAVQGGYTANTSCSSNYGTSTVEVY